MRDLVRSLHLNPLRAQGVPDLRALDRAIPGPGIRPSWGPSRAPGRRPPPSSPSSAPPAAGPALFGGTRTGPAVTARQLLAYVWVEVLGRRASDLARALGQTRGNISTAARCGAAPAARWQAAIPRWGR